MKVHGRVYVPAKTPKQKRDRIRYHGGEFIEVIVGGSTYDDAAEAAIADVARTGATLVPGPTTTRAPWPVKAPSPWRSSISSAGARPGHRPGRRRRCISGITTYLAERTTNTAVLGIEPAGAASMIAALAEGRPVDLEHVDQFVDGAAVKRAGVLTFQALSSAGTWCRWSPSMRVRCAPRCSTFTRTRGSSPSRPARCRLPDCSKPRWLRDRRWCA